MGYKKKPEAVLHNNVLWLQQGGHENEWCRHAQNCYRYDWVVVHNVLWP